MTSDCVRRVSGLLFEAIMLVFILGYHSTDIGPDTSLPVKHVYNKTTTVESIVWCHSFAKRILNPVIGTHKTSVDFTAPSPQKVSFTSPTLNEFELKILSGSILINAP